jgi:Ca-activated chloride channel family protein
MTPLLPTLTDEDVSLWRSADAEAGFGALSTERGPLPLKALEVRARVTGLIADVAVRQTFVNTHAEPLEATYIFPLPDRAAVTGFRLEVAGRVVEGQLKERGAARREYDRAVRSGHRAAITEEERPGVFTMRVGNLPPGDAATVHLTLAGPLPYADGEATFRFPLVVAPRYIPGVPLPGRSVGDGVAPDTDAVPDASRISPPVLLPGFPNPVRLSLVVEYPFSDLQGSDFRSSLHTVEEQEGTRGRRFVLRPGERLDRDFVLRFRLAGGQVRSSLSVQPDGQGDEGTFALTLVPPALDEGTSRPRDIVFVLDRSGSMEGWKMVAARWAMARMVESLTPRDRFTVFAFDDRIETPPGFDGMTLTPATDHRRFQATEFLAKVESRGGTEMARPLDDALRELTRDTAERDRILVLVTDGQVGNEDQILRNLGKRLHAVRVFALGIDTAVNAAFLKRLADLGGGSHELVESEARLDEVMDGLHRRIGSPVLTNLRLEPFGLEVLPGSVTPARLPDLFEGRPVVVCGRYRGSPRGSLTLKATDTDGRPWTAEAAPRTAEVPALSSVWARGKLRELEDRYAVGADRAMLEKQIVGLSLRFGVLCRFTSFVAVDRAAVVNPGGEVHQVTQPVEMPAGWAALANSAMAPPSGTPMPCLAAPMMPPAPAKTRLTRQEVLPAAAPPPTDGEACEVESVDSCLREFSDEAAPGSASSVPPAQAGRDVEDMEFRLSPEEESACDKDVSEGEVDRGIPCSPAPPPQSKPTVKGTKGFSDDLDAPRSRKERRAKSKATPTERTAKTEIDLTSPIELGDHVPSDPRGWLQRLLDWFRGKPAPEPAPVTRPSIRHIFGEVRRHMQTAPADSTARLAFLKAANELLKDLLRGLKAAGDQHPAVALLGEALLKVEALSQSVPDDAAIRAAWEAVEKALTDYLGGAPDTTAAPREDFWK